MQRGLSLRHDECLLRHCYRKCLLSRSMACFTKGCRTVSTECRWYAPSVLIMLLWMCLVMYYDLYTWQVHKRRPNKILSLRADLFIFLIRIVHFVWCIHLPFQYKNALQYLGGMFCFFLYKSQYLNYVTFTSCTSSVNNDDMYKDVLKYTVKYGYFTK